jgi:tetratricopeptide (TPR) repeat protein
MATLTDRNGNELTASDAATVERYDEAVDSLLTYRSSVEELWEATVADEPDFAMGHVGRAYLRCTSTEGPYAADARDNVLGEIGDPSRLTDREQRHVVAATRYANGDLGGASETLASLTIDHPRDPLALLVGHQLDFFNGDAMSLRDRVGRAIGSWPADDPRYGYVRGMLSFGLEECGLYAQAEEAGLDAVERDPNDVWGHHAVVHTYEMQGRVEDGLQFVDGRRDAWTTDNVFVVHNTWHEALYNLDLGNTDRVLELYDATIHNDESEPVAIEMLDASALLWRLYLNGIETAGRWRSLADAWAAIDTEPWYAFNDMHAVMAYIGADRLDDARAAVDRLAAYAVDPDPDVTNVMMTADVGLPVCAAMVAFAEGRYDDVVELLFPIRTIVQRFGGSHAQRDVVARTMLEAAIRGDNRSLAEALLSERVTLRPTSGYAKRQLERLASSPR